MWIDHFVEILRYCRDVSESPTDVVSTRFVDVAIPWSCSITKYAQCLTDKIYLPISVLYL